jgi:putative Mg2+ transporter-C (MgtC) family protein
MALVSLGSTLFTITSTYAFLKGPMGWDASRISAAIPSGVGFLGAGLIFKKEEKNEDGDSNHIVHGLTTAASLWLTAAVGIACGGELYMAASFGIALTMLLLRFGPRGLEEFEEEYDDGDRDEKKFGSMVTMIPPQMPMGPLSPLKQDASASYAGSVTSSMREGEMTGLLPRSRPRLKKRVANLATMV